MYVCKVYIVVYAYIVGSYVNLCNEWMNEYVQYDEVKCIYIKIYIIHLYTMYMNVYEWLYTKYKNV